MAKNPYANNNQGVIKAPNAATGQPNSAKQTGDDLRVKK